MHPTCMYDVCAMSIPIIFDSVGHSVPTVCAKYMQQSALNQFFVFEGTLLHVLILFEAPVLWVWVFNTKSLLVTGSFGVREGVERGKTLFFGGKMAKNVFFGYIVSF